MSKTCDVCGVTIGRSSKSGRCRAHRVFSLGLFCRLCNEPIRNSYGICTKNPTCMAAYQIEYKVRNEDRIRTRTAKRRAVNAEKIKAYNTAYTAANKDRIALYQSEYRRANPEKRAETVRRSAKAHPEPRREAATRRRFAKAERFVEAVDYCVIFERDNGVCHLCLYPVGDKWHLDHVISFVDQGTHEPDNVAVSHPACNLSKGSGSWSSVSEIFERATQAYWKFHGVPYER